MQDVVSQFVGSGKAMPSGTIMRGRINIAAQHYGVFAVNSHTFREDFEPLQHLFRLKNFKRVRIVHHREYTLEHMENRNLVPIQLQCI